MVPVDSHPNPFRAAMVVSAVLALAGCGASEGSPADEALIPSVEAVEARYGGLPLRERLTGTVRALGQVAIYPETSGPIVEVLAQNGDRVEAGDPLVRIRGEVTRSQEQGAEAALATARAQRDRVQATVDDLQRRFDRSESLVADNFISQEEFETLRTNLAEAKASLAAAEAQVQAAEASLSASRESVRQTLVRAPIAGTVGRRNAEVGQYVNTNAALFTIGRLDQMEVDVPITQEMLGRIQVGQTAEIRSESLPDTVITASVSRISPFIEPGSFSAEVQIDVDNSDGTLLPGMFVTVEVLYGESQEATLVPKSALYEDPRTGLTGVYVMPAVGLEVTITSPPDDSEELAPMTPPTVAEFRRVEVLASGRHVVGVNGIEPGAWVVVVGQHLLSGQVGEAGPRARVRPVSWQRLLSLQGLMREDYLRQFMEKQQRIVRRQLDSTGVAPAGSTAAPQRAPRVGS